MKLYICSNNFTDIQQKQAVECIRILEEKGHSCSVANQTAELLFQDDGHCLFSAGESDLILSLGGDGALLRAAPLAMEADRPLLGVNSGRKGYLCAMMVSELNGFDEILKDCEYSQRRLLELTYQGEHHYALNDVIVSKNNFGQTVDLSILLEKERVLKMRGDGLIIATPTGSTAYNFSAGGPLLLNDTEVFAVTPICGDIHPTVVRNDRKIIFRVNHDKADIYVDGQLVGSIDDEITIGRSEKTISLVSRKQPLE